MRKNGGFENFKMIEVEKYSCNDKREAEKREEELRKELKANMNSHRCFITKEQKINYKKLYEEANKDKMKKYRDDNKGKNKIYIKIYHEANKDKINIKRNEIIDCECGAKYTKCNKARHFKTSKHKNYINNL